MSKHINWIDLLSNPLEIGRTSLFIQVLGVTVQWLLSTVTMERYIVNRFKNVAAVRSVMKCSDEAR